FFILTVFGALVALFGANLPARLKASVLAVQSSIAAAFLLFILITSNPFLRIPNAPFEGRDLNPILQDPGLAIHPPMLYLGYVGFSISFSFAIAALLEGRIDAAWARWVRPWTLLAWMFLTAGIAMGSFWAYYTLGWGGWWFWDPVENASLMPWIAGTALLHQGGLFAPISREGALVLNNLLLVSACATIFVGTLYPLALEAITGEKISVGAPFFNATFGPLFIPLLMVAPFGPLMAWKRGDLYGVAQRLLGAAGVAVIAIAVTFAAEGGGPVLVPFAIGLALFVITGALTDLVERTGLLRVPLRTSLARASGLPRSAWG